MANANRTAIARTTTLPPTARARRMGGVIRRPAWPATSVNTRCQLAEAAPTPVTNAARGKKPVSDSEAATDAKDTIVSGLIVVIVRKRTY
jgi:hypothetical protein